VDEPTMAGIRLTDGAADNIIFNNLIVSPHPVVDEVNDNKIDRLSNVLLQSDAGVFINPLLGDFRLFSAGPANGVGLPRYYLKPAPIMNCVGKPRQLISGFDAGAY